MASATRTQTSTSRAMPQPGTPALGWEEEGKDTSSAERISSRQGSFPKEATLPCYPPGEKRESGCWRVSERPQRQGQRPHRSLLRRPSGICLLRVERALP